MHLYVYTYIHMCINVSICIPMRKYQIPGRYFFNIYMYVCMYIYVYICMYMCIYVYVHVFIHKSIYICVYIYTYVFVYICVYNICIKGAACYIYIYTYLFTYIYIYHVNICIYMYIYSHTYICTYIHQDIQGRCVFRAPAAGMAGLYGRRSSVRSSRRCRCRSVSLSLSLLLTLLAGVTVSLSFSLSPFLSLPPSRSLPSPVSLPVSLSPFLSLSFSLHRILCRRHRFLSLSPSLSSTVSLQVSFSFDSPSLSLSLSFCLFSPVSLQVCLFWIIFLCLSQYPRQRCWRACSLWFSLPDSLSLSRSLSLPVLLYATRSLSLSLSLSRSLSLSLSLSLARSRSLLLSLSLLLSHSLVSLQLSLSLFLSPSFSLLACVFTSHVYFADMCHGSQDVRLSLWKQVWVLIQQSNSSHLVRNLAHVAPMCLCCTYLSITLHLLVYCRWHMLHLGVYCGFLWNWVCPPQVCESTLFCECSCSLGGCVADVVAVLVCWDRVWIVYGVAGQVIPGMLGLGMLGQSFQEQPSLKTPQPVSDLLAASDLILASLRGVPHASVPWDTWTVETLDL